MTTRIEDLTEDQLAGMSDEDLVALGAAEFGSPAAEEPAAGDLDEDEPGDPAPAVTVDPVSPIGDTPAAAPAVDPAPDAAAQLAAMQAQYDRLLADLNDPGKVRAHLASLDPAFGQPAVVTEPAAAPPPSWDDDPDAALAYIIEQRTAPLLAKLQTLEERDAQREAQAQEREMMMTMASKYGQDFEPTLREFDAGHAHLRHLPPDVRYVAARGLKALSAPAVDPVADEARIMAAAEKMLAERLKGGKPLAGVPTLGGAPQGAADEGPSDLSRMDYGAMMAMPLDKMLEVGRKTFGGG